MHVRAALFNCKQRGKFAGWLAEGRTRYVRVIMYEETVSVIRMCFYSCLLGGYELLI